MLDWFIEQLEYLFIGFGMLMAAFSAMGLIALLIWLIATWPWVMLVPLGILFMWFAGKDIANTKERYPY